MPRIPYDELRATLRDVLTPLGMSPDDASLAARLFAEASRDGVASHGVNRVPRFVAQIRAGVVDVNARSECVVARGATERWCGHRAPGMLSAHSAMTRAIALASAHGIGLVALGDTNHWMRGGSYGWQAADANMVGICWTNTMPNMPPWGSAVPRLGNNPLVIAVPRADGAHVVLDMAMSQFSFGAIESYRKRGEGLPVPGGLDDDGKPTRDAAAIEASGRVLPIGYWKGSGLSLVLDLVAALLGGGQATHEIASDPLRETGLSQTFLAIDPSLGTANAVVERVIDDLHRHAGTRYPGERTLATRAESLRLGVPVDEDVWTTIVGLSRD